MPESISDHIAAIAARTPAEGRRLADLLTGVCWPGGGADHLEPAATAWLRRWTPARAGAATHACGCAGGRCGICN
jgi:hypothetical protein